jgi:uncharacterized LabA/DUF88 family protein
VIVGKNVAVFVDVANIFYAAKAAGVDIDYVTLLKSAIAGRDFVRAYAYTGLDPDNENQRNFHSFLARHDYKVVSKDIRKYGDGKVKANLDIELVVDMMKTARNLDVAIIVSGDGDFAPAIRAVQEMGVRVEVISFRGNTSSDLMDVADLFTDITQIAKVEKSSSRSGRRVADDQEDLSMTEVPDKMTEGTGRGRGRGTGRGRGRPSEADREPVAAAAARIPVRGVRQRRSEAESELTVVATAAPVVGLIALPGEKLSKAAQARLEAASAVSPQVHSEAPDGGPIEEGEGEDAQRRRRRRGGRGRGRGRGRGEGELQEGAISEGGAAVTEERAPEEEELEIAAIAPRGPKPAVFGSVWDSQIGQARVPAADRPPYEAGEDEDEPAIPEYLIAEQRRGTSSGRGGAPDRGGGAARGGRGGAYAAAVERERYGRGGGGGGINRYPDVSGRAPAGGGGGGGGGGRGGQPVRRDDRRDDRPPMSARPTERSGVGRSDEPWSEVPPELEAMLRAQLASKTGSRPTLPTPAAVAAPAPATQAPAAASVPKRRPAVRTKAAAPAAVAAPAPATQAPAAASAPKRRPAVRTKAAAPAAVVAPAPATQAPAAASAPKRRPAVRTKVESTEA